MTNLTSPSFPAGLAGNRSETEAREARNEALIARLRAGGESLGIPEAEIREAETNMRMAFNQADVLKAITEIFL